MLQVILMSSFCFMLLSLPQFHFAPANGASSKVVFSLCDDGMCLSNSPITKLENEAILTTIFYEENEYPSIQIKNLPNLEVIVDNTFKKKTNKVVADLNLENLPNLRDIQPKGLNYLSIEGTFQLQNTGITQIRPEWFNNNPKMERILIRKNANLKKISSRIVDTWLGMVNLRSVDLLDNGITSLPSNMGELLKKENVEVNFLRNKLECPTITWLQTLMSNEVVKNKIQRFGKDIDCVAPDGTTVIRSTEFENMTSILGRVRKAMAIRGGKWRADCNCTESLEEDVGYYESDAVKLGITLSAVSCGFLALLAAVCVMADRYRRAKYKESDDVPPGAKNNRK